LREKHFTAHALADRDRHSPPENIERIELRKIDERTGVDDQVM
jgi:hypothetical protein